MWEGYYGKEPFNLRLAALRLIRNGWKILALTMAGTLLFGGGYYIKNVVLGPTTQYSATSTYKMEYVDPPSESGDYYINEMTWNTYVQSVEFLDAVQGNMTDASGAGADSVRDITVEQLRQMISAKLPSDWFIPVTVVTADAPDKALAIAAAIEKAMVNDLVVISSEVKEISVISPAIGVEEVRPDVRPVRAFVLSAVLSFFFVMVAFLLMETGDDSIWLPSSLRWRYGLRVMGTFNSPEIKENIDFAFAGSGKIAVCPMDARVDIAAVMQALASYTEEKACDGCWDREWIPMPAPVLCPEVCRKLREMDGILLVVPAGKRVGKTLEYVLEYLKEQECEITGAILWSADEALINAYYHLGFYKESDV